MPKVNDEETRIVPVDMDFKQVFDHWKVQSAFDYSTLTMAPDMNEVPLVSLF